MFVHQDTVACVTGLIVVCVSFRFSSLRRARVVLQHLVSLGFALLFMIELKSVSVREVDRPGMASFLGFLNTSLKLL